jgi:hypothetical protein
MAAFVPTARELPGLEDRVQNRYVGDLGDFGKYGLLRFLCGATDSVAQENLRLGIVWYLVPDEQGTNDGCHTSYLEHDQHRLRLCDPALYDTLKVLVKKKDRFLGAVEKSTIFPAGTLFLDVPLSYSTSSGARQARLRLRSRWLDTAVAVMKPADLVFLDPDNGLEVRSIARHERFGPKYVYFDELTPLAERGQSLVIYQHLCRRKTAIQQIEERLQLLRSLFPDTACSALRYHRGSPRAFFVLAFRNHRILLGERLQRFVSIHEWGRHFSLLDA